MKVEFDMSTFIGAVVFMAVVFVVAVVATALMANAMGHEAERAAMQRYSECKVTP